MSFLRRLLGLGAAPKAPATATLLDIKKQRMGTIITTDPFKCPYCGSTNVVRYSCAFLPVTDWCGATQCECDDCKDKYYWLPEEYRKVPAVNHQLEAWRIPAPTPVSSTSTPPTPKEPSPS
jgi:hypothetical protein